MTPKINVKERFTDGEIDLSMSDLEEVPVKDIALLKKAYGLDLSNNRLTFLPKNFPTLTHITKLDLSKNELKELPEDFGNLTKLKYLDLYQNQLQHLPLSFSKLKDLKFLDLKDNPLVPTVAKVAGPCLDTKQCQSCAKDIVNFFVKLEKQVNSELESRNKTRQKQLEINQQKKQEEKKHKKKEKQKLKQEAAVTKKSNSVKDKSVKENSKKANIETGKQKERPSFIKNVFIVLLLTSIILFVLTSIKVEVTKNVERLTVELYGRGLEKLPPNIKIYGTQGGKFIHKFHEKTGNITLSAIKFIHDNVISKDKLDGLFTNLITLFEHIVKKIKDVYNNVTST
ncbi:leucine-rich repeat-containing protein 59 [Anoplophora glabripennis]|uniref:leucine-rich repeat-containing protein 59 n=1 Tax=Anoplophora glabripennis TaxID=217634 RepID=UPI000875560C|nr:leucine-rich repeat-containing protein 59 [Anoplophora glabripennis]